MVHNPAIFIRRRSAQVGSLVGCFLVAPYYYFSGQKVPLFKTLMPKVGGRWMLGGGLVGGAMVAAMAVSPPPKDKPPFTIVSFVAFPQLLALTRWKE
jgi:hypothetical protein